MDSRPTEKKEHSLPKGSIEKGDIREFVAMKQATEYVCGLRYKLRMMGMMVDEPVFVYGDNQ